MSEPTDIVDRLRTERPYCYDEAGQMFEYAPPILADKAADEIDRLRRKLDIARKYFVRIQHEGDGHSHWIASAALDEMKKAGDS